MSPNFTELRSVKRQRSLTAVDCGSREGILKAMTNEAAPAFVSEDAQCKSRVVQFLGSAQESADSAVVARFAELRKGLSGWIEANASSQKVEKGRPFRRVIVRTGSDHEFAKMIGSLRPTIPDMGTVRRFPQFRPLTEAIEKVHWPIMALNEILECPRAAQLSDENVIFLEVFIRATKFPEFVPVAAMMKTIPRV
jgi:hypothetical protein